MGQPADRLCSLHERHREPARGEPALWVPGPGSPADAHRGDRDDLCNLRFLRGRPVAGVMHWVVEAHPNRGQIHLADSPVFRNDLGTARLDDSSYLEFESALRFSSHERL